MIEQSIEVDKHLIKEKLNNGQLCTFIPTKDHLTDVLRQGLPSTVFSFLFYWFDFIAALYYI